MNEENEGEMDNYGSIEIAHKQTIETKVSAVKLESDFNNNSAAEEDDGVNIGEMEPKLRVFKKDPSKTQENVPEPV